MRSRGTLARVVLVWDETGKSSERKDQNTRSRGRGHPRLHDPIPPRTSCLNRNYATLFAMTQPVLPGALHRIVTRRQSLSRPEAHEVMAEILRGGATDAQIAGLLIALSMKGETVEEIVGFAQAIREAAPAWPAPENLGVVDTCGTGGDTSGTLKISTAAALVAAGAGVPVAKHGNRSVSSKCGSADVMEALGVNLSLRPERLAACLSEVGIAFLYAPALHSAMKFVQTARRDLKVRTVFNMLGLRRALVVHGNDGLDEITISTTTRIAELRDGQVRTYEVSPEEFGLQRAPLNTIAGGDAATNAVIVRKILRGEKSARRDVVLLNAAAALVASGHADSLHDALPAAVEAIDSGAALAKLEALAKFSSAAVG